MTGGVHGAVHGIVGAADAADGVVPQTAKNATAAAVTRMRGGRRIRMRGLCIIERSSEILPSVRVLDGACRGIDFIDQHCVAPRASVMRFMLRGPVGAAAWSRRA